MDTDPLTVAQQPPRVHEGCGTAKKKFFSLQFLSPPPNPNPNPNPKNTHARTQHARKHAHTHTRFGFYCCTSTYLCTWTSRRVNSGTKKHKHTHTQAVFVVQPRGAVLRYHTQSRDVIVVVVPASRSRSCARRRSDAGSDAARPRGSCPAAETPPSTIAADPAPPPTTTHTHTPAIKKNHAHTHTHRQKGVCGKKKKHSFLLCFRECPPDERWPAVHQ